MSTRGPDPDRYDEDDAPTVDTAPSRTQAELSALLESVARERGLDVRRLDDEIVLCSDGEHRVLFHGLTSSSSSKLAHVLCGNDAWLRSHLAHHGIPVVPTRLVGLDDARFALRAAEQLGFPVRMRLAGVADDDLGRTVSDVASFHEVWQKLAQSAPDGRALVILERQLDGQPVEVAVVAGEVVAASPAGSGTLAAAVGRIAVEVHFTVAGVCHTVRLRTSSYGDAVDTVDPSLQVWNGAPELVDKIIKSLLVAAFSRPAGEST